MVPSTVNKQVKSEPGKCAPFVCFIQQGQWAWDTDQLVVHLELWQTPFSPAFGDLEAGDQIILGYITNLWNT